MCSNAREVQSAEAAKVASTTVAVERMMKTSGAPTTAMKATITRALSMIATVGNSSLFAMRRILREQANTAADERGEQEIRPARNPPFYVVMMSRLL
jgi:hypothetical protein